MKEHVFITQNAAETQKLAAHLGQLVTAGCLITLSGDLGAGKTTFTQGLAKGLDIKKNVTSPTFTLMKIYQGRLPLYHIDAYRLENVRQDLGFDEYLQGDGVCVIEWSNFISYLLPQEYLNVTFTMGDSDTTRQLAFTAVGAFYERILEQLCTL